MLGKLPHLVELVLSDEAFQGENLVFSHGDFSNLIDLILRNHNTLLEWSIDPGSLPKVKKFEVLNCSNMNLNLQGKEVLRSRGKCEVEYDIDGGWTWRAGMTTDEASSPLSLMAWCHRMVDLCTGSRRCSTMATDV